MQVALSLVLNWVIGPALMTGLAWATLPDLENYRNGVILVCEDLRFWSNLNPQLEYCCGSHGIGMKPASRRL